MSVRRTYLHDNAQHYEFNVELHFLYFLSYKLVQLDPFHGSRKISRDFSKCRLLSPSDSVRNRFSTIIHRLVESVSSCQARAKLKMHSLCEPKTPFD